MNLFVKQRKQKQQKKMAQTVHKTSIFAQIALVIPTIKAKNKIS